MFKRNILTRLFLVIFLSFILISCTSSPASSEYVLYNNSNLGIGFEYPSTMGVNINSGSKVENNTNISWSTITFMGRTEVSSEIIQVLDAPDLASAPDWYPSTEIQLQIYAAGDLGSLNIEKSNQNNQAVQAAMESGKMTVIGGFPAFEYQVFLTDKNIGDMFVRGAVIHTPKRSFTLICVGGISKSDLTRQNVTSARVDEIWDRLLSTIAISY